MNPTRSQVHVDTLLQNVSIAWQQRADAFIATQVFPVVPVTKQSNRYLIFEKGDWFRTNAAKRAPSTESAGTEYRIDNTPTYFCDRWSAHHDIPDEMYDNADEPIKIEANATNIVTQNLVIKREQEFVRTYMAPNVWQGFNFGGSVVDYQPNVHGQGFWGSASSAPANDIDEIKQLQASSTGWEPNTLVVTNDVYYALRNSPAILDRIKYTERGVLTKELIAEVFGVERLLVSKAVINTAQEGQADNIGYIAKNMALLCYAAPAPALDVPSAGYTFSWVGKTAANGYDTTIKKWRMEELSATRVEGDMAYDMKQTAPDMGILLTHVLS